ncbi:MAG TPA: adenine nucleotide alpha hydrolase [Sphaerochaeta sp.]|jgi:tRNA 2-thiocytidine biosynthesis protein TtcA|nr:adenine nucleotide alpha hydrolase [Sphaerochaeta sp.]
MHELPEKLSYTKLIEGDIPPWVRRFIKHTGKAINTYSMIREGEKVLLSVSGGKDSLGLALALSLRRKWMPIDYELQALMINWIEHPIPDEFRAKLAQFFASLDIEFSIKDEHQYPDSFKGEFNCYLCSRNRRRILFEECEKRGISVLALGHHLDDLVETSLMNLCFRGNFSTMQPVQPFFDGKIQMIRPMIEIHENNLKQLVAHYNLPVIKPVCPFDQSNIRSQVKPLVKQLVHIDKFAREHIYNAHTFVGRL